MKLSLNWLKSFLDLDNITPEEIASKLTMGAFEVEEIQKVGATLKEPIVTGKILKIEKHPNADRLVLTTVTTNGKNELKIVCGAKNIKEGQLVPVSLPGAVVVNRKDGSELTIKISKIRDIESNGMLLSPSELGLEAFGSQKAEDGILILPEDTKLGQSVIDYLLLKQDLVLEVGSRSNRGDALSIYGLAKEISAVTGKKLKNLSFLEPKFDKKVTSTLCKIEDASDTYLFYTVTIENIEIKESPIWLQSLLRSVGIRLINNIVDITNYINFSFGQPMHAYDKAKLHGDLIARKAKSSEKITTIDGKTRNLKEGVLVIADNKLPVAIAGIMGGKDSEVTESTKTIVFEAAVFSPIKVRRGSREIGLSSESSKRFERLVDSNFTYKALLKAIELTCELAKPKEGNIEIGKIEQAGSLITKDISISVTSDLIKKTLNIDLEPEKISQLLSLLDFKCIQKNKNIEVKVPTHRINDILRPIDVIEEIARLYGYNNIPVEPPGSSLSATKETNNVNKIKELLISAGFSEVYLSSLVGEKILSKTDLSFDYSKAVKMLNPVSIEHCIMRQSLIPGLIEALRHNQNHQTLNVKLFEVGKVYFIDNNKNIDSKSTGTIEKLMMAGIVSGLERNWSSKDEDTNKSLFFVLKGIIDNLLTVITGQNYYSFYTPIQDKIFHPSLALNITVNNEVVGKIGCLHPETIKKSGVTPPVIVFEIYLDPLLEIYKTNLKTKKFKGVSSQPSVERDITLDLPKKYSAGEVTKKIYTEASDFVVDIKLISIYELDKSTKSLTFRLKMQDTERTLTSKEIDDEVNKVINNLTACFQAKFRV